MKTFELRWKSSPPPGEIDASPLRPDVLCRRDIAAIAATTLRCGRADIEIGDLFDVLDQPSSPTSILRVDGCAQFVNLAHGMEQGRLHVDGPGGRLAGAAMCGGELTIGGEVGNGAGAAMRGGLLKIDGSAGELLGGPLPNGARGMTGGEIIVGGDCGARAGLRQRRGLIVISGRAGRGVGHHMLAGTIVVRTGDLDVPGIGMKRGTILALDSAVEPPETFREDGPTHAVFLRVLARRLAAHAVSSDVGFDDEALDDATIRQFSGDCSLDGRGEILYRE